MPFRLEKGYIFNYRVNLEAIIEYCPEFWRQNKINHYKIFTIIFPKFNDRTCFPDLTRTIYYKRLMSLSFLPIS